MDSEQLQAYLDEPIEPPPAGVVPNLRNPANLNGLYVFTLVMCLVPAALAVWMRMFTKLFLIRSFDYEDYAILLGWISQLGEAVPSVFMIRHGTATHIWNLPLRKFSTLLHDINNTCILYSVTVLIIKISILLQYLRIFVPHRKGNMAMFVSTHICIWSNVAFYLLAIGFFAGLCTPRRKIWQPWLSEGHCFNVNAWNVASGVFAVVSDIAILILPIPCLWRLQMPTRKKLMTIGVFATGVFACVTSIVRTYYTWKVVTHPDISYNIIKNTLWTSAEIAAGIVISCVPVLPRFFRHAGPKIYHVFSTTFRTRTFSESTGSARDKTENSSPVWKGQGKNKYIELEEGRISRPGPKPAMLGQTY